MSKEVIPDLDYEAIESWETLIFMYKSALKYMETKIAILNDEFQAIHKYNPIEHVKSRLKTAESIVKKLKKQGYDSTIENMVSYVKDIAGVRIVCSFTSDIYKMAEMIGKQNFDSIISQTFKNSRKYLGAYTSVAEIWENEKDNLERATRLIAFLPEEKISCQELECVLLELFENDVNVLQNDKRARTNIKRLIRIYDYLKWGK